MTPEELKKLRTNLRCTARELAATLDIPLAEVQAWEAGEQFPTKRWVTKLEQLAALGPSGIARKKPKNNAAGVAPLDQLGNPDLWLIVRKLLAHQKFFSEVCQLADKYDDPASG
ncbi:MAG TPA: XRE family transcriptional regulator [Polyangiaceae bacterium]|nr:XRE family transcriptional regulator [Polyangiaceae bacterium]